MAIMKQSNGLKAYIVSGLDAGEGAVLVFANTNREAKVLGYGPVSDWGVEYLDCRCRKLRGDMSRYADPDKLLSCIPHVIDNPPACSECGLWGYVLHQDGVCEKCRPTGGIEFAVKYGGADA